MFNIILKDLDPALLCVLHWNKFYFRLTGVQHDTDMRSQAITLEEQKTPRENELIASQTIFAVGGGSGLFSASVRTNKKHFNIMTHWFDYSVELLG